MSYEDALENERNGANSGLNPMFGEWRSRFNFPPVPYGDGGAKRSAFKNFIKDALPKGFFYSAEIQVNITLYLDVQKVLETSETADLDNYAKSILDSLKGPDGIIFDDSQVQALGISWLDALGQKPHFDVAISGAADDFMLKPAAFYEMPDGLWHPHSRRVWTDGAAEDLSDRDHYMNLCLTEAFAAAKKTGRHMARQRGSTRLRARQQQLPISASIRGFHRSRIDVGFEMWDQRTWQMALDRWRQEHPTEAREFDGLISGITENYVRMAQLLAGKLPE